MKVLIIPDIHCRKFWRKAIQDNSDKVDRVIFLGDYLDPYPYEIRDSPDTMECKAFDDYKNNLKMLNDIISLKKLNPNKYVLLTGNHTDSYIWKNFSSATRTDWDNWEVYNNFYLKNLSLFNLTWVEDNVIFSHAGIVEGWAGRVWHFLNFPPDEVPYIKDVAIALKNTPLEKFDGEYVDLIGEISRYRYGDYPHGSCEWADFREHCYKINGAGQITPNGQPGIYQVFGHTQLLKEIITEKWACLDCRRAFIIDTETYEINGC